MPLTITPLEDLKKAYIATEQSTKARGTEIKRFEVPKGETSTIRLLHDFSSLRGQPQHVTMLDEASTERPKDPPTECGACKRPFDAYLKRFGSLCGDCVPKP